MKLSKVLGLTIVATVATTEANAALFSSDNLLAPIKGSSRGASGWIVDTSATGVALQSAGPSVQAQQGPVLKSMKLAAGESDSIGASHRNGGFFQDSYTLTLADDAAVSVDLQDKAAGSLFNIERLSLSLTDAVGNTVAQAGEGDSFVTSMLQAGDYKVSITGLSQAVKGGIYSARIGAQTLAAPIPAAAWLFGSALIAMFGVAKRRQS